MIRVASGGGRALDLLGTRRRSRLVSARAAGRRRRDGLAPRRRAARLARRPHRPARPAGLGVGGGAPARDPELRRGALPARASSGEGAPPAGARHRAPARPTASAARSCAHARPPTPTSSCSPPSALRNLDPALEEAARGLGPPGCAASVPRHAAALRPRSALGALLVALYTLSDFGAVSLMHYDALTRAIFLQYRSLFDRTPAAMLALVLVAPHRDRAADRGARPARAAAATARSPGAAAGRRRSRSAAGDRPRSPSAASSSALFLVAARVVLGYWLAAGDRRDRALDVAVGEAPSSLGAAASPPASRSSPRFRSRCRAAPPARRSRLLERLSFAGTRCRASSSLCRSSSSPHVTRARLPDARAARFRLRRPVPPAGAGGLESALPRVGPRLEEAARGLGRSPLEDVRDGHAAARSLRLLAGARSSSCRR